MNVNLSKPRVSAHFMPKANTTCEAAIALVKRTFDSFTAI